MEVAGGPSNLAATASNRSATTLNRTTMSSNRTTMASNHTSMAEEQSLEETVKRTTTGWSGHRGLLVPRVGEAPTPRPTRAAAGWSGDVAADPCRARGVAGASRPARAAAGWSGDAAASVCGVAQERGSCGRRRIELGGARFTAREERNGSTEK
ncbi:unnamed protein product [Urochloa humidicola]